MPNIRDTACLVSSSLNHIRTTMLPYTVYMELRVSLSGRGIKWAWHTSVLITEELITTLAPISIDIILASSPRGRAKGLSGVSGLKVCSSRSVSSLSLSLSLSSVDDFIDMKPFSSVSSSLKASES